jgi:hypothetical protein
VYGYPVDLGHNFVLADSRCNSKKRDLLPACEHLEVWSARNTAFGDQISELAASNRVTHWAYSQTEAASGLTWLKADELVALRPVWRRLFA